MVCLCLSRSFVDSSTLHLKKNVFEARSRTCYVDKDDLELLMPLPLLSRAGIPGVHFNTQVFFKDSFIDFYVSWCFACMNVL